MNRKFLIGVDNDDVLVDFLNSFINYINPILRQNFRKSDVQSYEMWKYFGISQSYCSLLIKNFYKSEQFRALKRISGSSEILAKLKLHYEFAFVVITARDETLSKEVTHEHVLNNFEGVFSEIYFSRNSVLSQDKPSKSEICVDNGISFMIDDSFEHCSECALKGIKSLLFTQPWNESIDVRKIKNIERVNNWYEIYKYFKSLRN